MSKTNRANSIESELTDQRRNAIAVFNSRQYGIFRVGRFLIGKIHAGVQSDIDPAGDDPECDVRSHQISITVCHLL